VVEDYFATPEVQDYLCNAGFAEVRLSVRAIGDRRIHRLWTARITSEGLVKDQPEEQAREEQAPEEQAPEEQAPEEQAPEEQAWVR
jgi:hypothetical protein